MHAAYRSSLSVFAAFTMELEVTQTGEICPIDNLNMGKLSCPPAVGRGGVRSKGGEKEGRKACRGKRYENMTCLRIGSTKTIHSSGFLQLPWSLLHPLHSDLTVSSYHVKGSLSLP